MMAMATTGRADQIYRTGPETLVARSTAILAGSVSSYARQVQETSEPPGPDATPLKWLITGRLDNPRAIKGAASGPVSFSRIEESIFLLYRDDREDWENEYGDLGERDGAVLFFSGDPAQTPTLVLPSGSGARDLAGLVTDLVAIQAMPDNEARQAAWAAYLETARVDEGRKAALRSLVNAQTEWKRLRPVLHGFLANPARSQPMRAFAFGIVAFGLTNGCWPASQPDAADFLCQVFESEERPGLLLQHILALRLVLAYTVEETQQAAREPLRAAIAACLRRKEAAASRAPQLAQQYRQIRADHPGLL